MDTMMVDIHVSTWRASWMEWLGVGRSRNTLAAYAQDVRAWEGYFRSVNGEDFRPELLTGVDLRGWREECLASKVAPATWNRRRSTMALLCQWAQEAGFVAYNPFQGVDVMDEVEQGPRWLGKAELGKVLRVCEQLVNGARTEAGRRQALRDQAMVCLMVYAGLREGEVVGLDGGDVVLGERSGKVKIRRGKGDKKRTVPLASEVRRALSLYVGVGFPDGALFRGKGGERITERGVQKRIKEISRLAGVDLVPHQLRHTFAKRTLDGGAALQVVGQLMGHARLETTARYTRPGWEDLEKAVEGRR